MLGPLVLSVFAEVAAEGFFAPWAFGGVGDGGKGGAGFVHAGVFEELVIKSVFPSFCAKSDQICGVSPPCSFFCGPDKPVGCGELTRDKAP